MLFIITPTGFLCRQGLNPISLIQWQEILSVELIETLTLVDDINLLSKLHVKCMLKYWYTGAKRTFNHWQNWILAPSALVDYINLVSNNHMWNECWKIDVWEQTTTFNHWQNLILTSSVLVDDINLLSDNYTYMLNVCWKIDIPETNKHVHTQPTLDLQR